MGARNTRLDLNVRPTVVGFRHANLGETGGSKGCAQAQAAAAGGPALRCLDHKARAAFLQDLGSMPTFTRPLGLVDFLVERIEEVFQLV